jgi:hypothetical protein
MKGKKLMMTAVLAFFGFVLLAFSVFKPKKPPPQIQLELCLFKYISLKNNKEDKNVVLPEPGLPIIRVEVDNLLNATFINS